MSRRTDTAKSWAACIAARLSLLQATGSMESAIVATIAESAAKVGMVTRRWNVCDGLTEQVTQAGRLVWKPVPGAPSGTAAGYDPGELLAYIAKDKTSAAYVLCDFACWVERDPVCRRALRNLAATLQGSPISEMRTLVLVGATSEIHAEIKAVATALDFPLPDRTEIAAILGTVLASNPAIKLDDATKEAAIDAAVGLTADQASTAYSMSIVLRKTVDPKAVSDEKKRVISEGGVLDWFDPDPRGLDAIGGLGFLKAWLLRMLGCFGQAARAFGLPAPKGLFLVGVPGCGKSLISKCVATAFRMPLLRLDFGGLQSKYVGESQQNLRKALKLAETVSPCVLWADEIEKALAGASGPAGDGGVSADALGTFLSWMQERSGSVFVVATANDVRALPPELLRKGRFDEVFFVDLPTQSERVEIAAASLKALSVPRDPKAFDLPAIARACTGFTGSEIASIATDAARAAYYRNPGAVPNGQGDLTLADLITAAGTVVPLSRTSAEKIANLRAWAKDKARAASAAEDEDTGGSVPGGRALASL